MRTSALGPFALSASVATVLLTSCTVPLSQPALSGVEGQSPALASRSDSSGYKVVHNFTGGASDGAHPYASLIDVGGTLYGTTEWGGPGSNAFVGCPYGCGTVFSLTLDGTEKVLYTFSASGDGEYPTSGLMEAGGTLYGVTFGGGTYDRGTAFSITTSGSEKVLHDFGNRPDGTYPSSVLIDVKDTLYGTTSNGGTCSSIGGTVFRMTAAGKEKIVYSFCGFNRGSKDGAFPFSGVIDVAGNFYGTTEFGGKYGHGTVFLVTTSGTEKVLNSFGHDYNGRGPSFGALIEVKGNFYGETTAGGAVKCGRNRARRYSCGTIFSITPSGSETVLHDFAKGTDDGNGPNGGLIYVGGKLYGTTAGGGAYGKGTVFSITLGGTESVLHSFGNGNDGQQPAAGLLAVNGTLYGTTIIGGKYGQGTVFSLKP